MVCKRVAGGDHEVARIWNILGLTCNGSPTKSMESALSREFPKEKAGCGPSRRTERDGIGGREFKILVA